MKMEERSPPESPGCFSLADTSSGQLREVTSNPSASFSNMTALRPFSSPMRGKPVKQFEEQLVKLKKENFNLKLRIYFLEEKMGTHFTSDKEDMAKKNIELHMEIAYLKKDVQEKQELLCQAVKAMELEDEEHKKCIALKEDQLSQYRQELNDVRMQLEEQIFGSGDLVMADTTEFYSSATESGSSINEQRERMKILEDELELEKKDNASLQLILNQAEALKYRYESMQREFQIKDQQIKNLNDEIQAANDKILGFSEQIRELQDNLGAIRTENQLLMEEMKNINKIE